MVKPAPPGEILQLLYLGERLKRMPPATFVEIGPGRGAISRLLLSMGWKGIAYELGAASAADLAHQFREDIADARYQVMSGNWLTSTPSGAIDLVISCMVMEHLDHRLELAFMRRAAESLRPGGRMIGLVPAAPKYWGIEDDIAGHHRRYTRLALLDLMERSGWTLTHVCGLTFPVSNFLLPLSNRLVAKVVQ